MGSGGIFDDVEKFERTLAQLAGERYAEAFRLRYIALAPKMERSSTKSTAAARRDEELMAYEETRGSSLFRRGIRACLDVFTYRCVHDIDEMRAYMLQPACAP